MKEKLGRVGQGAAGDGVAVARGWGCQEESMASRRKMFIEILDYRGFIGGDSVS